MAFLLAIEGADGAGKATVAAATVAALAAEGLRAAVVSFPRYGDTVGGHALGDMLGGRMAVAATPQAAAVLYALDRLESRDHVAAVAAANDVAVFDRYIASNIVYQAARAAPGDAAALTAWIIALETQQFALPPPDLSVYLDTPIAVARQLILIKAKRSYTDAALDVNEADAALQARVREGYRTLAAGGAFGRWATISTVTGETSRAPAEIAADVVAAYRATTR